MAAAEVLFRLEDRPNPFRGTLGMVFLLALSAVGAALGTGGILWAFRAIPSSAVMIVIAGAGWGGFAASNWLNVKSCRRGQPAHCWFSAGLLLLYGLVWKFLPPPP